MFDKQKYDDREFRDALTRLATTVRGLEIDYPTSISLSETDAIDIRTQYPIGTFIRVTNYDRIAGIESSFGFIVRNSGVVDNVDIDTHSGTPLYIPLESLSPYQRSERQFVAECAAYAIARCIPAEVA